MESDPEKMNFVIDAINGIGRYGTIFCFFTYGTEDNRKWSPIYKITDFITAIFRSVD